MRWILYILVLAITIGGYTTAAHAFDGRDACCPGVQEMADCHDAQDVEDNAADNGHAMTCHHCCMSHAAFPSNILTVPAFAFETAALGPVKIPVSDFVFSLLRPPRNLV